MSELSEVRAALGADDLETTLQAARRVVAERDAAQARKQADLDELKRRLGLAHRTLTAHCQRRDEQAAEIARLNRTGGGSLHPTIRQLAEWFADGAGTSLRSVPLRSEVIAALAAPLDGIGEFAAERWRQIDAKGWTLGHDDQHSHGELILAARCYAFAALLVETGTDLDTVSRLAGKHWPWASASWRPSTDVRRNLAKAGALLAAEADRLKRL